MLDNAQMDNKSAVIFIENSKLISLLVRNIAKKTSW